MSYFRTSTEVTVDNPDHIYLDISMINDDRTGTNPTPFLYFNEVRNNPILMNASQYYLSVVRFDMKTGSLPVFLPQVDLTQTDPNKLIYQICLTYDGVESVVNLEWIPQDFNAVPPNTPFNSSDINSAYYNCYSFQHFVLSIMNNAFVSAVTNLNTLCTTAGKVLPSLNPPLCEWDINNFKIIIDADVVGYDPSLIKPINIYFNTPLYSLFSSLDALYYGYNVTNGKNYLLNMKNMDNGNIYVLNNISYIQAYQEFSTLPTIANPVQSLVFATSLLPVVASQVTVPKVFNDLNNYFAGFSNANFANVVTDFEIEVLAGTLYKPLVHYSPTAQYRYIDMTSDTPLQNIDIAIYWKDNYNVLHPFTLQSQNSCNIKILFRKKTAND
jgi:hypothetical protein